MATRLQERKQAEARRIAEAEAAEVRHHQRRVVQVRGKCNRYPTAEELQIVTRWAYANRLHVELQTV